MESAAALAALLRQSQRAVIFTGAGMSTESGIPDFRSPGGIWTKMMPVQFQDYISDPEARRVSWQRRFEMEETWNATQPNAGHRAVAELVACGKVSHVITQNIDALHQQGGVPARTSDRAAWQYPLCQVPGLRPPRRNRRYPRAF
jgi:NAD-dependent deacetylase